MRVSVASRDNLNSKNTNTAVKSVNVIDLINKAKLNEKEEKKYTLLITTAALIAVVISGFLISL